MAKSLFATRAFFASTFNLGLHYDIKCYNIYCCLFKLYFCIFMNLEQVKASLAIENLHLSEEEISLLLDFEKELISFDDLKQIILTNCKEKKVA